MQRPPAGAEGGFLSLNSDDELYSAFLAGDMTAADALMLKYTGRLIMYADAIIHDIRDSEDLVIDAFAALLTKRPAIREGGFQAYLYRMVRNRALRFSLVRRRMKIFSLEEECAEELLAARPEDTFLRDERRQAVQRCLNRINPEYREVIWLTYFEGLSYAETAAVLGVNVKRVDNLLTRGKKCMKAELEKEGITRAVEA